MRQLKEGSLTKTEFGEVFRLRYLPDLKERPVVFYTGTGVGNFLLDAKEHKVKTSHGYAKLVVGRLEGVKRPVVVVPRHADPISKEAGHHLLPHSVNEMAYNVAVAALNPIGVVTVHTIGADDFQPGVMAKMLRFFHLGGVDKSIKPGALTLIKDFLPLQVPLKTALSRDVQANLVSRGFNLPKIAHTPLSAETIRSPELAAVVLKAAREAGIPIATEVICHTIPGPYYENPALVEYLASSGVNGYSMTHQQDVSSLFEALRLAGSNAKVVSIGFISNYAARKGRNVSHAEVDRMAAEMAPKRVPLFKSIAMQLDVWS